MSNRHVSLCLCVTHIKPLIRVALTLGPLKTSGDVAFPVGEEVGGSIFLEDSFNQLAVWFGQPAEEGTAQGNTWGGKKEWIHNPITLFFSFCQCMDWRNGAQQRICSSPPCKTQEMLPLNSPPHFLHFCPLPAGSVASPGPPESSAQQLHTWRSPSSVLPENSICSRHLEWDYWGKNRISAQWKVRCTRWSLAHFPFSLHTCPAPMPRTLGSGAGWMKIPVLQEQLEKYN